MKTIFVKTTLEAATGRELILHDLIEFLRIVCPGSNNGLINTFLVKWDNYRLQMKKIAVTYSKGSWIPSASEAEIKKQLPWKNFVGQYVKNYIGCSIKSEEDAHRDFMPLNLDELSRMTFWESLYYTFGHKVMKFLFEKCILIFTVLPEMYMMISSSKCCMPIKPSKPATRWAVSVACDNIPANFKTLALQGASTSKNLPSANIIGLPPTSSKAGNEAVPETGTSSRKRKHEQLPLSDSSCQSTLNKRFCPTKSDDLNDNSIIRWITPKDEVLQTIITDREKAKEKRKVPSSQPLAKDLKEFNFVAILRDSFFIASACPLDIIMKQSIVRTKKDRLPKELKGLKLPTHLIEEGQSVILNAYRISESQAKKYKIRINPRKRNKKRTVPPTDLITEEFEDDQQEMEVDDRSITNTELASKFKTYNPNEALSTASVLYNKSSWSKLSPSHFARKILSMSKEDGVNVLLSELLQSQLTWIQSTMLQFPEELKGLKSISASMVSFHRKVKDIHKLMKSCLMHWIMKHIQKLMLKGMTKWSRKNRLYKIQCQKTDVNHPHNVNTCDTSHSLSANQKIKSLSDPVTDSLCQRDTSQLSSLGYIPHNLRHLSQFFPSDSEGLSKSSSHSKVSITLTQSMLDLQENGKSILFQKLKEAIPHSCILSTLSQILHLSGAEKLLGSRRNKRAFSLFIRKSVMMGGLRSSLQLSQLISSLHPEDCSWLLHIKNPIDKINIFAGVVKWLFNNYVLCLIRTSFYGTEISSSRNQIVFYLRETWKSVTEKLKDRFIKSKSLKRTDANVVTSRLRLLPKKNNCIRPLVSFKSTVSKTLNHDQCRQLINYINSRHFPQGFHDANGVRVKWTKFCQYRKETESTPLFYVRADIKDAYASINLKLLKEILSEFGNGNFILKNFTVMSHGSAKTRYSLLDENYRANWHASIFTRPCIIKDSSLNMLLDVKSTISSLLSALDPNVVKLGKLNFEFDYGLPQGWIMSQHLCNLYYGSMEKKYLYQLLERPGELFIRNVDDYFFVSPDPVRVSKFCIQMQKGIRKYNCTVNPTKWATNLSVSSTTCMPTSVCDWVNFFGWRFCLTTGHASRDFSSYIGQDMSCSLTFKLNDKMNSDLFIKRRMGLLQPLRLSSLLFDPVVNCRRRILMNIFEAALMLAFRFYAICRVVYSNMNSLLDEARVMTFLTTITRSANCLSRYVLRGNDYLYPTNPVHPCHDQKQEHLCQKLSGYHKTSVRVLPVTAGVPLCTSTPKEDILSTPISKPEIFFLVYHAFIIKLHKHSQAFKDSLLPKLKKSRYRQRAKMSENYYNFLVETVGFKMPECFLAIKI